MNERRAMADLAAQVAALQTMSRAELAARFEELFGRLTLTRDIKHLRRRLSWELQARAEGGLSQRALARIELLAPLAPARWRRPNGDVQPPAKPARDPRLPLAGTVITKMHRGVEHHVIVGETDFEYEGRRYRSLSAVARAVTGTAWNGLLWAGLIKRPSKAKVQP